MIEIVAFAGRTREAKRDLIRRVYDDVAPALGVATDDVELVVIESPAESWGHPRTVGRRAVADLQGGRVTVLR